MYPFFPEKTKSDTRQFTDWQTENMKKNYKPNEILMLQHTDFKGYVLDGEILDWYLDHGLKFEDVTVKNKFSVKIMNGWDPI